ncbi:MAG: hypothetical protein V4858_17920 [Pseudomonadota bacterium]
MSKQLLLLRTYALAITLAMGACAYNPVQPGMSRADVIARMGAPDRTVPLASGGTRLQYSGQSAGPYAYMVDLDAADRVVQMRQVLAPAEFSRIVVNQWTRDDVERAFGRPASIDHVASWPADIMTYRWYDGEKMFFWVYLDRNNVVRRTEQGREYLRDD